MINIREFGIPAGAGSNYVAKNILWGLTTNIDARNDKNVFAHDRRIDLMNSGLFGGFDTTYASRCSFMSFLSGFDDIVSVLDRYDFLLNKLDTFEAYKDRDSHDDKHADSSVHRRKLIKYFEDGDFDITMFYLLPHLSLQFPFGIVELSHPLYDWEKEMVEEIINLKDIIVSAFEDIYLFYIDLHRKNCANSYLMVHDLVEVYLFKNKKLTIPERKTGAFKFDDATSVLCQLLDGIKNDRQNQVDRIKRQYSTDEKSNEDYAHNWTAWYNHNVEHADVVIDYRKVFIEGDANEIQKLYEFFNVPELYEKDHQNIIKSFKEYGDKNLKVATDCLPELKEFDDMFSQHNGKD